MKTILLTGAVVFFGASVAVGQDVLAGNPPTHVLTLENDHIRAIEVTLQPGESEPLHSHGSYVAYFLTDATLTVHVDGTEETFSVKAGHTIYNESAGPHTTKNSGDATVRYVLLEIKR